MAGVRREACHFLPERTQIRFLRWAEQTGITDILTIDLRDFSAYRLRTGKGRSFPLCSGVNQPPQPFGGGRCKIPVTPSYFVRSVPDTICRLCLIDNPLHPTLDFPHGAKPLPGISTIVIKGRL